MMARWGGRPLNAARRSDAVDQPPKLDLFGTYLDTLRAVKSATRGDPLAPAGSTLPSPHPTTQLLETTRTLGGRARYDQLWDSALRSGTPAEAFTSAINRLLDLKLLAYQRPVGAPDQDVEFILTDRGRESLGPRGLA